MELRTASNEPIPEFQQNNQKHEEYGSLRQKLPLRPVQMPEPVMSHGSPAARRDVIAFERLL
jgi:hypothetical protein